MQDEFLKLIEEYEMTPEEARAWRMAIHYITSIPHYFPEQKNYRSIKISTKKDPRKKILFRCCWKAIHEGNLQEHEDKMYVMAQLQMLQNIIKSGLQVIVNEHCLEGARAWKRWLIWKKQLETAPTKENTKPEVKSNICVELEHTKQFLERKIKNLTKKTIIEALESRTLFRWCALGMVSGYYLSMSPTVRTWINAKKFNLIENFAIDLKLYVEVSAEAEECFKINFPYEA